jgi:mono/diheme cytochrome c family protein
MKSIAIWLLAFAMCALAGEPVSYFRDVRPILRANCAGCHKPGKKKGGLDVTTYAALLRGGESGGLKRGTARGGTRPADFRRRAGDAEGR